MLSSDPHAWLRPIFAQFRRIPRSVISHQLISSTGSRGRRTRSSRQGGDDARVVASGAEMAAAVDTRRARRRKRWSPGSVEHDRTDKPVDPALPLALARARREADAAFKDVPRDSVWLEDKLSFGLVGAGLLGLARWLKQQT